MKSERVVILGASDKPERYANKAFKMSRDYGHEVIPVHPALEQIEGVPVRKRLADVQGPVDTITVYLRPEVSEPLIPDLIALHPARIILNPGTESEAVAAKLHQAGISVVNACTLVLLQTKQY
jgi:predicted CoA-binding protein